MKKKRKKENENETGPLTLAKNSFLKKRIFSDNPVTGSPRAEKWDASDEIRVSGTPTGSAPTLSSPPCAGTARDPERQNAKPKQKTDPAESRRRRPRRGVNGREPRILGAGRAPNDFIALVSGSKLAVNAQQLHTYTHAERGRKSVGRGDSQRQHNKNLHSERR